MMTQWYEDQPYRYVKMLRDIMEFGHDINPRGIACKEISDLQLVVDPDSPFMTFIHRKYDVDYFKKEMLWKLGANKYDKSIQKHAKLWSSVINPDQTYNSNYGQYWFGQQMGIWKVVMELTRDPESRKAVIPMMNDSHFSPETIDTVCTEAVGFRIRDRELHMSVHMRSSDVIFGLGTDIPTFSFLYRLVFGMIQHNQKLYNGPINITAMSSHIYEKHYDMVNDIVKDPEYIKTDMPYCNCSEAMTIVASRGNPEILK